MLPTAVPCIGAYFLWMFTGVWWMVSASLSVPRAQGARAGRGAVAVLVLPVLLVVGVVGAYTVAIVVALRSAGTVTAMAAAQGSAARVHRALLSHASLYGAPPHHVVELLAHESLTWTALHNPAAIDRPPVSGVMGRWDGLTPDERWAVADAMAEALEEDWVAHRLGHVVFTYNGVDLVSPQDGGLWVAVFWPDPESGAAWMAGKSVGAVRADGVPQVSALHLFEGRLEAQNTLRAAHGLEALPHPEDVVTVVVPVDVLGDDGE